MSKELVKSLILRFVRGTVAGMVATMIPLLPQAVGDVGDLNNWLKSLAVAGFIGAVTGLILTADKYIRSGE
jgi:hypothetical protein